MRWLVFLFLLTTSDGRMSPLYDAVQGGHLAAGGPVLRGRQPIAPGHPAIGGPLEDDAALAVPFGVHAQNSLAVVEQAGGGVPEVLAIFPVHHNLPLGLVGQIDQGNFGGGRGRVSSSSATEGAGSTAASNVQAT